jgi:ABC-type branched-subunit amino acid transport system substrate-binding protein
MPLKYLEHLIKRIHPLEESFQIKRVETFNIRVQLPGQLNKQNVLIICSYAHKDLTEGYYTAHWNKNLDTEKTRDFIVRYKNVYEVTDFAATSYDAAMLLFDAIKRADSIDRHAIGDALAATKDFDGVTGKISFNENGDPKKTSGCDENHGWPSSPSYDSYA